MKKYVHHSYPELRQAKNGYWYIWHDRNGRDSLETKDKILARQRFAVRKQEQREQDLQEHKPREERTVKEFTEEYLKWRAGDQKEANTVAVDGVALRLLLDHVGNKAMSAIDAKDVDTFHAWLLSSKEVRTPTGKKKTKAGCSKATVNIYIRHLKIAFRTAHRWGYLTNNLYAGVKQYTENEKQIVPLTEEQITEILLPSITDIDFRRLITLYLYLGGRGYEICRADASQIVTHEETGRKFLSIQRTKTHRARLVPIPAAALSIVDELPKEGPLFPRWKRVDTVSHKLKKCLRACGLGHMWLHGLRHTYISRHIMAGTPSRAVMQLAGQTSEKVMKKYEHFSPGYLLDVADTLDFSGNGGKKSA